MNTAVEKARQKKNAYKARALAAEALIASIRTLHRKRFAIAGVDVCACCEKRWPCKTVRLLGGE